MAAAPYMPLYVGDYLAEFSNLAKTRDIAAARAPYGDE